MKRQHNQLRPTTIELYPTAAAGSVLINQGNTRVLCTASLSEELPRWLLDPETGQPRHGWISAEYSMLPGSTPSRKRRGPDSRGTEIQRLIGRSLRAAVDLQTLGGVAITCDCDVLVADGGTRTASITGGFVAMAQAIHVARQRGMLEGDPIHGPLAAVSVGVIEGTPWLDLDYQLDSSADVDMNVAMNHQGEFVELQATGERGTIARHALETLLDLASDGISELMTLQKSTMASFR